MFDPNEQRQADIATLREVIDNTKDGAVLSWVELEQMSGVRMDARGRGLFRVAMRKNKRAYKALRGAGVELSSPRNAVTILRQMDGRIGGAVRRATKVDGHIQGRHLEQLDARDRAEVLMRSSLRGALLSGARAVVKLGSRKEAERPQLPKSQAG